MRISPSTEMTEFCLEGRFLDFVIKDGYKLKGLLLATSEGQCYVKLAKHLRVAFDLRLPRGTWLQVVGMKKYDAKKDQIMLKAERVMAASADMGIKPQQQTVKKQTILFCQKSDCMKRGGKAVCEMLEKELSDRGLQDTVNIKGTGCMKNCKAGPNLVMPDKTRYTRIQARQVPSVLDQHLNKNVEIETPQFVKV
ncbi:(2Fe-2S) ferredoxin domain-containing protein [Sphaerospermopsis aphanizomenoides BCCUSP55]|uniref:(2Fe-2S) ferredoxin domain-containing protein n=1 Tax=Sphaerospermopsis aphanizomenoides TaxID=459663 RepID=UPI000B22A961|nr:(2Fe-2S) ferredoxin domain-containing protein [Sphaerospermopsis aphanizomenoides]MBK1990591.1 (2Fe-2S) ferredoxin domain-containing protein [Sphaerospermopsis aphanizomenoides BCCUSP55]